MPSRARTPPQQTKPTFIFKGTVRRLKSATMKEVPVDDRTLVVMVDQVLESPDALSKLGGQEITVQLTGGAALSLGEQRIFNTVSWIYGDSVAVKALSVEPIRVSRAAMATSTDPVARRRKTRKRERFEAADLVVSGKVTAVRLPGDAAPQTRSRAAGLGQTQRKPLSEHDPKWREAVVEVDGVHKGTHQKKEVVIRFPASRDVMWYDAPKFQPGQEGLFMLRKSEEKPAKVKKGAPRSRAASLGEEAAGAYVALDPIDFQPLSESADLEGLIDPSKDRVHI